LPPPIGTSYAKKRHGCRNHGDGSELRIGGLRLPVELLRASLACVVKSRHATGLRQMPCDGIINLIDVDMVEIHNGQVV
jgi:hypothetical protein